MYGINYQRSVYIYASSVNMFKNRIDKYLVKAGYTYHMAIGKTVGEVNTNYTIESVEFAGYLP